MGVGVPVLVSLDVLVPEGVAESDNVDDALSVPERDTDVVGLGVLDGLSPFERLAVGDTVLLGEPVDEAERVGVTEKDRVVEADTVLVSVCVMEAVCVTVAEGVAVEVRVASPEGETEGDAPNVRLCEGVSVVEPDCDEVGVGVIDDVGVPDPVVEELVVSDSDG